ncbi:MAG: hypothetical protein JSU01_02850, partial [Bacteroidetes bacterium]|nr:hypothetical protein [Bacteroidota bacterium]
MKPLKTTMISMIMLFAVASMVGCKKSGNSRPIKSTSQLAFQLKATHLADTVVIPDTIAGLVWTAGTADVSRFSFDAWRNGVSIEIESHNLTSVNLFGTTPIQTYVTLDTGTYKRIAITAFLDPSSGDPTPLQLSGTFKTDSAKTDSIQFDLTDAARIKVQAKD